jgi:hypothetical protein
VPFLQGAAGVRFPLAPPEKSQLDQLYLLTDYSGSVVPARSSLKFRASMHLCRSSFDSGETEFDLLPRLDFRRVLGDALRDERGLARRLSGLA